MTQTLILAFTVAVSLATAGAAQTMEASGKETGVASVYSHRFKGHATASGQPYNPGNLTAAHKTLPFGTKVRVTNTKNNKSVVLRITDRGPHRASRVIDLSPAAAARLGMHERGLRKVTVEVVALGSGERVN
jgi:rare lipoprotein A